MSIGGKKICDPDSGFSSRPPDQNTRRTRYGERSTSRSTSSTRMRSTFGRVQTDWRESEPLREGSERKKSVLFACRKLEAFVFWKDTRCTLYDERAPESIREADYFSASASFVMVVLPSSRKGSHLIKTVTIFIGDRPTVPCCAQFMGLRPTK